MPEYAVHYFCNECSQTHPMGIGIQGDFGYDDQTSIADAYAGKEVPSQILTLQNNTVMCPNTRKPTQQKDNHQVFLVRTK